MYYGSSGKVYRTHLLEKSSSPYPVCHRNVNQYAPQYGKYQETGEFQSFGKRSQNQSRSNDGKHTLEQDKDDFRYVSGRKAGSCNSLQHDLVESTYQERPGAAAVHQAGSEDETVAESNPDNGHRTNDKHTLHDDA